MQADRKMGFEENCRAAAPVRSLLLTAIKVLSAAAQQQLLEVRFGFNLCSLLKGPSFKLILIYVRDEWAVNGDCCLNWAKEDRTLLICTRAMRSDWPLPSPTLARDLNLFRVLLTTPSHCSG